MREAAFILFLVAAYARADAPAPQAPAAQQGQAPLGVKVFDDRVFDLSPKDASPDERSSEGRVFGEPTNDNSETRRQARDACASLRDKDGDGAGDAYQACYKRQMESSARALRDEFNEVERRQSQPVQESVPSLIQEQRSNSSTGD